MFKIFQCPHSGSQLLCVLINLVSVLGGTIFELSQIFPLSSCWVGATLLLTLICGTFSFQWHLDSFFGNSFCFQSFGIFLLLLSSLAGADDWRIVRRPDAATVPQLAGERLSLPYLEARVALVVSNEPSLDCPVATDVKSTVF